jgi:hypothetical protein
MYARAAKREQHMLDSPEAPFDDEGRHQDRCERHAEVARHSCQAETRCDTRELRSCGADVRSYEDSRRRHCCAPAVLDANQAGEASPRHDAKAGSQLVEDDERHRREQQHPQQAVTEVGPQDRVGRDPGGVVVREARKETRTADRNESEEAWTPADPDCRSVRQGANARDGGHGELLLGSAAKCRCAKPKRVNGRPDDHLCGVTARRLAKTSVVLLNLLPRPADVSGCH